MDSRTEDALVSNIDIAPTLARLAGVRPPEETDGSGLGKLLRGERDQVHETVLLRGKQADPPHNGNQPPSFWGVRTKRFKYVETEGTGERELYDLKNDPNQEINVVRKFPKIAESMRAELIRIRKHRTAPHAQSN